MAQANGDGTGVTLDKPRAMDGGAFVVMGYKFPANVDARLIAVDGAGKRHIGKSEGGGGIWDFRQLAVQFADVQPQDIRTWIVEQRTRLTESVEFRNVSLDPETPTIVNVIGRAAMQDDNAAGQSPTPTEFGPAVEAVVHKNPRTDEGLIDFDAANVFKLDPGVAEELSAKWVEDHGVDAMGGLGESDFVGLVGFDLIVVPTEAENWDRVDTLVEHLRGARPTSPAMVDASGQLPATFFFQTREGGRGVLQIVEVIPDKAVKIRFKLAK